ncbi:MAG: DUF2079 domain-containing protein [Actinobacteria bacterium]|nr:DUF2079 domain-containing protein [Actinomycetota bacterium]
MTNDTCGVGTFSDPSSGGKRDRSGGSSPKVAVVLIGAWLTAVLMLVGLRAWEFYAAGFDLGVFVQAFRTMMLHGPFATIPMLGQTFLEDHFSPLALPLVLLARSSALPYLLLAVQTGMVALAGLFIWRIAVRGGSRRPLLHLLGFLLAPVVVGAVWSDFHVSVLAAPFLVLMLDGLHTGADRRVLWAGSAAALMREDIALVVLIAILVWRPSPRMWPLIILAGLSVAGGVLLGGPNWFVESGTRYLGATDTPIRSALAVAWDSGRLLPLVLFLVMPWVFLGHIGWRSWAVATVLFIPLAFLDLPVLDHVGSHYYLPLGIVLAVGAARGGERFVPSLRWVSYAAVALALVVGPLVFGISGYQDVPAWRVAKVAMQDASSVASVHAWVNSLALGESVSAVNSLVPWIEATDGVWVWPSPLRDVVFAKQAQTPIVRADPSAWVTDVIAPVSEDSRLGPTGEAIGLGKLGFVRRSVSPLGSFVWWQRP